MTVPIMTKSTPPSNYKLNTPRQHQTEEGSREHVIWWNGNGNRCSKKECEENQKEGLSEPKD